MCKCSITSNPAPATSHPPPNDLTLEVTVRSESPVSNESDDISMLSLRHEEEETEASNMAAQDSDNTSSNTSDAPLLGSTAEPMVEIQMYSPQIELNLPLPSETSIPGTVSNEGEGNA